VIPDDYLDDSYGMHDCSFPITSYKHRGPEEKNGDVIGMHNVLFTLISLKLTNMSSKLLRIFIQNGVDGL
jgi:hypothetical protein